MSFLNESIIPIIVKNVENRYIVPNGIILFHGSPSYWNIKILSPCIKLFVLVFKNSSENIDVSSLYLFTFNFGTVKNGKLICSKFKVFITTYKITGNDTIPTITIDNIACFIVIFFCFIRIISNGIKNTGKK